MNYSDIFWHENSKAFVLGTYIFHDKLDIDDQYTYCANILISDCRKWVTLPFYIRQHVHSQHYLRLYVIWYPTKCVMTIWFTWCTHCLWRSLDKSALWHRAVQLIWFRGFAHPLQISYWYDVKDLWPVEYLLLSLPYVKKYMVRSQNISNHFVHSILNRVSCAPALSYSPVSVTLICHSSCILTLKTEFVVF